MKVTKQVLLLQVPKTALKTPFKEGTVQDLAKRMLQMSRDGLARRGKHEESFLDPLQEIADVSQSCLGTITHNCLAAGCVGGMNLTCSTAGLGTWKPAHYMHCGDLHIFHCGSSLLYTLCTMRTHI